MAMFYIKLSALQYTTVKGRNAEVIEEGMEVGSEIISVIETLKTNPAIPGDSILVPDDIIVSLEATTHKQLGNLALGGLLHGSVGKDKVANSAIKYYEKSRELSESIGDSYLTNDTKSKISKLKHICHGDSMKTNINLLRAQYKQNPRREDGMNLVMALLSGKQSLNVKDLL